MSRIADLRKFVDEYRSTELITGALQDISATKMQFIRKEFEQNARFFAGIREVYGIVKAHAQESGTTGAQEEKSRAGRDIHIALTSNKRFYGNLNRSIARAFVQAVESAENSDFLMIGQTGAQYLDATKFRGVVTRTEFKDDTPNAEELQSMLSLVGTYTRVFVIYPTFINTFRQEIAMIDITQTPERAIREEEKAEYIFEPEIPQMLAFFEAQVRRALFERVLLETELARAAARALRMSEAKDHANDLKRNYERALRREFAALADLELMETFIGFNFWKQ